MGLFCPIGHSAPILITFIDKSFFRQKRPFPGIIICSTQLSNTIPDTKRASSHHPSQSWIQGGGGGGLGNPSENKYLYIIIKKHNFLDISVKKTLGLRTPHWKQRDLQKEKFHDFSKTFQFIHDCAQFSIPFQDPGQIPWPIRSMYTNYTLLYLQW